MAGVLACPEVQALTPASRQWAHQTLSGIGAGLRGLTETAARSEGDGAILLGAEQVAVAYARDGEIGVGGARPLRVSAWVEFGTR